MYEGKSKSKGIYLISPSVGGNTARTYNSDLV
jgi:hypothetical protein